MFLCVLEVSILPVSTIYLLDFGTVSDGVVFILFFFILSILQSP